MCYNEGNETICNTGRRVQFGVFVEKINKKETTKIEGKMKAQANNLKRELKETDCIIWACCFLLFFRFMNLTAYIL